MNIFRSNFSPILNAIQSVWLRALKYWKMSVQMWKAILANGKSHTHSHSLTHSLAHWENENCCDGKRTHAPDRRSQIKLSQLMKSQLYLNVRRPRGFLSHLDEILRKKMSMKKVEKLTDSAHNEASISFYFIEQIKRINVYHKTRFTCARVWQRYI